MFTHFSLIGFDSRSIEAHNIGLGSSTNKISNFIYFGCIKHPNKDLSSLRKDQNECVKVNNDLN